MKKWLLGATCAMLVAMSSHGALAFKDGHDLLGIAGSEDKGHFHVFTMYVIGVFHGVHQTLEAVNRPQVFCTGDKITNEDVANAVRLWLRRYPDRARFSAPSLVIAALGEHFPCK